MNQEILCTWLGLPKTAWPPDPWTLLGLTRGDHDLPTLEERVQERMTKMRHYQLSYPEEATEGMNRLAEAFITLTQACSKSVILPSAPKPASPPVSKDETKIIHQTKTDWRNEPPPVRQETASAPEVIVDEEGGTDEVLASKPFVAPGKPKRRPLETSQAHELAEESDEATSNLATLEAVIERVEVTRRLLHAWEKIGKALKSPSKKAPPKDSELFAKRLQTIADIMQKYPAFLGQPGKPGYRVVVHARLKIPLLIVRTMTPDQRDELLGDWEDGTKVLLLHRTYLRKLFKSMRHRSSVGLVMHAVRAFLNDHPRATLIGMSVVVMLALIGGAVLALK